MAKKTEKKSKSESKTPELTKAKKALDDERFISKCDLKCSRLQSGTRFAMWTGTLMRSPSAVTLTGYCRWRDSKSPRLKLDMEFNSSRERFGSKAGAIYPSLKAYAA